MRQKILYIAFVDEKVRPGYKIKIWGQIKGLNELGADSYLVDTLDNEVLLYKVVDRNLELVQKFSGNFERKRSEKNLKDDFRLFLFFIKVIKEIIINYDISVTYIRRVIPITPFLLNFIGWLKKNSIQTIYEYPTYPWVDEWKTGDLKLPLFIEQLQFWLLKRKVDYITYIGEEKVDEPKYIKIINGVDFDVIPIRKKREPTNTIHLLSVGHFRHYHGVDRLLNGLRNYYDDKNANSPNVDITLVGTFHDNIDINALVKKLDLEKSVKVRGPLHDEDLNLEYDKADIAVELFAMDRKNSMFSSSLKSREYIARGIPFVYQQGLVIDCLMNVEQNFAREILVEDEKVNLQEIVEFYYNCEATPEEIRNFGKETLSWNSIFKELFIKTFTERRNHE